MTDEINEMQGPDSAWYSEPIYKHTAHTLPLVLRANGFLYRQLAAGSTQNGITSSDLSQEFTAAYMPSACPGIRFCPGIVNLRTEFFNLATGEASNY